MIFHYCNLDALIAILQNKKIWASNYRYLNDHKEIGLAIEIIEDNLDLIKDQIKTYKGYQVVLNCLIESTENYDYFITSFSKCPDVLSQWRAYAQNGRGVNIGFDENILKKLGYPIRDTLYGNNLIDSIIKVAKEYLENEKALRYDLTQLELEFAQLIGRYKAQEFKEEEEKRLVAIFKIGTKVDGLNFRRSGNFIVPYIEIGFEKHWAEIIGEIWIGPAQKDEDTKRSVHFFQNHLGYTKMLVKSSLATFRD